MKTLIIVILDESGSMNLKMSEVLIGFNRFIFDQIKVKEDQARFYLVKFSTSVTIVHKGIALENVPQLNSRNYYPNGGTALYDAIANTIELVDSEKAEDERVLCVIMTDGKENDSKNTTLERVNELITGHEALGNWTFLYIGDDPTIMAKQIGFRVEHGIDYNHRTPSESIGRINFAVTNFRSTDTDSGENLFSEEQYSDNMYSDYSKPPE